MMPCVLILFWITVIHTIYVYKSNPDASWGFDTVHGLSPKETSKPEKGMWQGMWRWSANLHLQHMTTVNGVTWGWFLQVPFKHFGLLWIAMCPLSLVIAARQRGVDITAKEAWQNTFRRIWHLLGAYLFLFLFGFLLIMLFAMALSRTSIHENMNIFLIVLGLFGAFIIYFMVKWSFHNQTIVLEDLPIIAAFRRSSELIRGIKLKVFVIYALVIWITQRIIAVSLAVMALLLSGVAPEFAYVGQELQSGEFMTLFVGGYAGITLEDTPTFSTVLLMATVRLFINAIALTILSVFVTRLYLRVREMERGGSHPISTETEEENVDMEEENVNEESNPPLHDSVLYSSFR